jgi:1-acyl-sn-glycerol-3-phosphate acyltransferase
MWIGSPLRGGFRLVSYLLLTLVLLPLYLLARALGVQPVVRWMPVVYHRVVCVILGIRVRVHGRRSDLIPTLYVCNHVSYLDIEVLGGLIPGSFVAKAEVATWPFFRTLAKAQRTIFIERRSGKTSKSRDEMMSRLNTGDNLMLFPEGTSSDGTRVLPFRSALFGVAQLRRNDKPITVQAVAISYTRLDGIPLGLADGLPGRDRGGGHLLPAGRYRPAGRSQEARGILLPAGILGRAGGEFRPPGAAAAQGGLAGLDRRRLRC